MRQDCCDRATSHFHKLASLFKIYTFILFFTLLYIQVANVSTKCCILIGNINIFRLLFMQIKSITKIIAVIFPSTTEEQEVSVKKIR